MQTQPMFDKTIIRVCRDEYSKKGTRLLYWLEVCFSKNIFKKLSIFINKSVMAHKIIILAMSLFFKNIFKKLSIFIKQKCDGSQD